ncbi:MAG TPA: pyridoxamine 5'-phosphate oxidase family protein [Herpetosiphonaceae bacterium]
MSDPTSREAAIQKLNELIKEIDIAMLTTVEDDGTLRSRPMVTQRSKFDGDLWFFTGASSSKVAEVMNDRHVNLSYADPDNQSYVSISGRAQTVRDRKKMEELWNPAYKAWFPKGLEDPDLALLKVTAEQAEYWDSPSSGVVYAFGLVKALVTGQRAEGGENEKIDLARSRGQS